MMQKGNKHVVVTAYMIVIKLATATLLRFTYLTFVEGSRPRYHDPLLSEVLVRGSIYDRDGSLLAIQAPDYGFEITLSESSPSYIASVLSRYTPEPAVSLESRIRNGEGFIMIPSIPSIPEMGEIRGELDDLGLSDEVRLTTRETRKYPSYQETWNIIGGVDQRLSGVSGLERIFDDSLTPRPSPFERIARGKDLTLTIDLEAQKAMMELMQEIGYGGAAALIAPDGSIAAWTGGPDETVLRALVTSESSGYSETDAHPALPFEEDSLIPLKEGFRLYADDKESLSALLPELAL